VIVTVSLVCALATAVATEPSATAAPTAIENLTLRVRGSQVGTRKRDTAISPVRRAS
jgi:hypothetical protein